jgi:hypothetical protein
MIALVPTLTAVLLAAPVPGEKPKIPQGATPTIATVAEIDKDAGTCTLRTTAVKLVPVNREVAVNENGMIVKKVVTETRQVTSTQDQMVSIKDSPITDAEGNKVSEEDAWKRLTPGTTVVISADGNKVDPGYLAAFKKETLGLQPVRR